MPKFKFSKLVRDKIVDHHIASGANLIFRQLNAEEHKRELINKIIEEAKEINQAAPNELTAEIADVQQAIDDLMELCGLDREDISRAQAAKNERDGSFKKGFHVDYTELKDNDPWVNYYRKNADRYPEIR